MEEKFFDLYENNEGRLRLELEHNSVADWILEIEHKKDKKIIIKIQECDRTKLFALAYCKLTDFLSENYGGY